MNSENIDFSDLVGKTIIEHVRRSEFVSPEDVTVEV